MEAQLDPIFQAAIDSKRVPGAAAVALDASGKVLFSKGYGNVVAGDTNSPQVTPDTPCLIWSCTKLVTSVAGLQLLEQGKFSLDDPVEKYLPEISKIQLLEGFEAGGEPILREPKNKIKMIHLFTHTAGFSYDFFHPLMLKYRMYTNDPPVSYLSRSARAEYVIPLVHEPGTAYAYGCNNEWMGWVIEKISGMDLAEYIDKNISQPLGLKNTVLQLGPEREKAYFNVHAKDAEGNLTATPIKMADPAEVRAPGGHYLYSSCADYCQFLLALLNNGTHPTSHATILQPDTVKKYIFTDMIPTVGCTNAGIGVVDSCVAQASCTGEFLPGVSKGWSLGLMTNSEDVPNGRKKGSAAWAGLGNCYYWMDPTSGKLGYVVSQILPFFDKDVLHLADALERAVYDKPQAKSVGEAGSNFSGGEQGANC